MYLLFLYFSVLLYEGIDVFIHSVYFLVIHDNNAIFIYSISLISIIIHEGIVVFIHIIQNEHPVNLLTPLDDLVVSICALTNHLLPLCTR